MVRGKIICSNSAEAKLFCQVILYENYKKLPLLEPWMPFEKFDMKIKLPLYHTTYVWFHFVFFSYMIGVSTKRRQLLGADNSSWKECEWTRSYIWWDFTIKWYSKSKWGCILFLALGNFLDENCATTSRF